MSRFTPYKKPEGKKETQLVHQSAPEDLELAALQSLSPQMPNIEFGVYSQQSSGAGKIKTAPHQEDQIPHIHKLENQKQMMD